MSAHADALIRLQRYEAALKTVEDGLALIEATDERNQESEFWRLKGVCYLDGLRTPDMAETYFQCGIKSPGASSPGLWS